MDEDGIKKQWPFLQCSRSLFQFYSTDSACVLITPASGCFLNDKITNSLKHPRAPCQGDQYTHSKQGGHFLFQSVSVLCGDL